MDLESYRETQEKVIDTQNAAHETTRQGTHYFFLKQHKFSAKWKILSLSDASGGKFEGKKKTSSNCLSI